MKIYRSNCNMYDVYLIDMLFTKFLLTQILEILMVNKLLTLITRCFLEKNDLSSKN